MSMALLCDLSLSPQICFALSQPGAPPHAMGRARADSFEAFRDALNLFLEVHDRPALSAAAISSRGWEQADGLHLVGLTYAVDRDAVRGLLGVQRVNFLNNFVARALAVPRLKPDERETVHEGQRQADHALVVLGPHYGLGMAALVADGAGGWSALHGEGGHAEMPARDEGEWRLLEALRPQAGCVTRESCISMEGLANIYRAQAQIAGRSAPDLSAPEIIILARGGDAAARDAIRQLTLFLADMASDAALMFGAGGIWLTGAMLDLMDELFDAETFRRRFLDKGPRSDFVRGVPVFRSRVADMELKGLASLFD